MSKFIKVTDEKSGKKVIISGDFDVRSDNFSTVVFHRGDMIRVSESIEQIEAQLLRDEFAMAALAGFCSDDEMSTENTIRLSYEYADAILKERVK